ncbi:hypothetical protein V1502_19045 [Bacillus sp. SCS-153A]
MKMLTRIHTFWHNFMLGYNRTLLEGCLDEDLKKKIMNKIDYHRLKVIDE